MKTVHCALIAVSSILAVPEAYSQGSVLLNNHDSGMGIYNPGRIRDAAPAGTYVQVLGGPTMGALGPIVNSAGESVFSISAAGVEAGGMGSGSYFDGGYGSVMGVPAQGAAWFVVRAWLPVEGATWDTADERGESPAWSQQIGTTENPVPLNIPRQTWIALLPEPSAAALAGLALLILGFRHGRTRPGNRLSK